MKTIPPELLGLIGVIIGALLTFITNRLSLTKETQLRIVEKIFDRRIKAHEDILQVSQILRTTVSSRQIDSVGNALTYPAILHSAQNFESFRGSFYDLVNPNVHWLDIKLFRELNYVQDYIENLHIFVEGIPSEKFPDIGLLIKQDIIDIATTLESQTRLFFKLDIKSFKVGADSGHHKLPKEETLRRLNKSLLVKHRKDIETFKE